MQSRPFSREKRTNPIFGSEFRKWTSGPNHSDHPRQYPCVCDGCRNSISKKFQKIEVTSKSHLVCNTDPFHAKNEQIWFSVQNWENWNSVQNHIEIQGSSLWFVRCRNVSFEKKFKKIEVTSKSHLVCNHDHFHAKNERIRFSGQNLENGHQAQITVIIQGSTLVYATDVETQFQKNFKKI